MYDKVKSQKTTFGLQKTADKAKKLVTVKGLSEASAEGTIKHKIVIIIDKTQNSNNYWFLFQFRYYS